MKFLIINGSPKGNYSCTLHTLLYLQEIFKEHTFDVLNVGMQIKSIEKDITKAVNKINECDAIIFSYPVYTFIAPSQLHRFIELLKENNVNLENKFVTQITTSKHFYDMTAHKYIEENCYDLKMKYVKGLSQDMEDLLKKEGQVDAINFFKYFINCINNDVYEVIPEKEEYTIKEYLPSYQIVEKDNSKEIAIVCDIVENDTNLKNMITDFTNKLPYNSKIINIREVPFTAGCLGCFNCAGDGKCIHKDNFDQYLRENIQTCDAIVIAFSIKDHSMGARFKLYDDRQFCNGHRTVTEGLPFAYIVNGNYEAEHNLKTIVEARAEVGHNFLAGVAYNKETMDKTIEKLSYAMNNKYVQPRNFYGVGGMKIFRDLIWIMRGIMKADHVYYKKHGVYDFPQKKRGQMMIMCLLGSLVRNKKIKAKIGNKMNEGMIAPYKKIIKKVQKNECKSNIK